jgi:hypothetical protein
VHFLGNGYVHSSVRPFAGLGDDLVYNLTCANWEASGFSGYLDPASCLFLSQFDYECGCSNTGDDSNGLVRCALCGTDKQVNERYVNMLDGCSSQKLFAFCMPPVLSFLFFGRHNC